LDSVRPAADAKGIRLECAVPTMGRFAGDAGRLQQVVANLLTNALKFTPPGGKIAVRMVVRAGVAELTVEDDGIGIPSDFLPYVFDRFRQADISSTRSYGGL